MLLENFRLVPRKTKAWLERWNFQAIPCPTVQTGDRLEIELIISDQ